MIIRWIVGLLLVAGLGVGGLKGYVWYKVKNGAEELVQTASPFVEITFDGVATSIMDNSVAIENVVFRPRMIPDEIHLAALEFRAPDFMFFLDAQEEMKSGRVPEKMGLSLEGLKLRVDGPIIEAIYRNDPNQTFRNDYFSLGCGDIEVVGPSELVAMGYLDVNMNIHMDYQLKPVEQALEFGLILEMTDMGDVVFEGSFANEGGNLTLQNSRNAVTTLNRAKIRYTDTGYNNRLHELCANQLGVERSSFIDTHIEALRTELGKIGIEPSEQLVEAYRKFIGDSGEMALTINPNSPFQLANLVLYKPEDVVYLLRPQLSMGGQQLDIQNHLKLSEALMPPTAQPEAAKSPAPESEVVIAKPSVPKREVLRTTPKIPAKLKQIAVADLPNYIGSVVSLRTKSGKVRRGVLKEVRRGAVEIEIKMGTGSMAFPVFIRDITGVEVKE